jgi:hypothetical protein
VKDVKNVVSRGDPETLSTTEDEALTRSLVAFVEAVFLHIFGYFGEGECRADGSWKLSVPSKTGGKPYPDYRPSSIWVRHFLIG